MMKSRNTLFQRLVDMESKNNDKRTMFGLFPKKKLRISLAKGERVIAIGDIHGQKRRFKELMSLVDKYRADNPIEKESLLFLGDYVDRGPHSPFVIDALIKRKKEAKKTNQDVFFLQGNHETLTLEALEQTGKREEVWWRNGGKETVESYLNYAGVEIPDDASLSTQLNLFRESFPDKHLKFLKKLDQLERIGPLVFVHAGIDFERKLKDQRSEDIHWIRGPFLNWQGPEKKYLVVHGHSITPRMRPEIKPHRVGIDTGSYKQKGRITAAIFEGNKVRFLSSGTLKEYKKNMFS